MRQIDIIIPTLNAAKDLKKTLPALASAKNDGFVGNVIVVDGGSEDETCALAASFKAKVLTARPGRGLQLRYGAAASNANWLLFLHADTRPDPEWIDEVERYCGERKAGGHNAAVFRLKFDDPAFLARLLEKMVTLRTEIFGLPYGDQGLLISRYLYDAVGGFAEIPLMEDVDIARRLGRKRITLLRSHMTTSAVRYRRGGYLARSFKNLGILALYFLGISPERLAKLYL